MLISFLPLLTWHYEHVDLFRFQIHLESKGAERPFLKWQDGHIYKLEFQVGKCNQKPVFG